VKHVIIGSFVAFVLLHCFGKEMQLVKLQPDLCKRYCSYLNDGVHS